MTRLSCPQAPGVALHLVRRVQGAWLFDEFELAELLRQLRAGTAREQCAVHAYVLMGSHVHLLLTPARADAGARLVESLHAPSGAAWEPGFDASPVYAGRYLLACMHYIELNPVRAGIVRSAAGYRWSSHRANALGEPDALVAPHPLYFALGRTPEARRVAYQRSFALSAASRTESRRAAAGS